MKTFMRIAQLLKSISEEAMGTNMVHILLQLGEKLISINSACATAEDLVLYICLELQSKQSLSGAPSTSAAISFVVFEHI